MKRVVENSRALLLAVWLISACVEASAQEVPADSFIRPQSFFVKTVQVQGNTLLPEDELAALVTPLAGGERVLKDIESGADAVQQAYRQAGYGGVVVFVPEQALENGEVIIQVVEGRIANVRISDNERYDETNITGSLPHLRRGETPSIRDIDRDIQLANENPAKDLRVVFVAGAKPGEIDADISVTEERPLRFLFGMDSAGTPDTGNFRINAGIQHANLWNRDHIGTFQFQTSPTDPGRVQVYSAGYRIPLYHYFSAIDVFYAHSSVNSVATTIPGGGGVLGFTGKGDVAGFRVNRYLSRLGEYDHRLTLGWDWRRFNNNCAITFEGAGSIDCGAAASADIAIAPFSLGYAGQQSGLGFSWGINTNLSGNVGGSSRSNFDRARPDADKHYFVWRLFAFSNLALPAGFGLATRASAQYSPHALISGEQFGIGGGGSAMGGFISVRGYREREVVGDYGASFNLEGLGPDFARLVNIERISLRPVAFFDFGWAGNNHRVPCDAGGASCTLASVGGGIRFTIGKQLSGRLDFGHALMDGNQKTAGTTRGHLAVNFYY
jgi:hemolysin activation/secretion protein